MSGIPVSEFVLVLFIFVRISAAFISTPVFGHKAFPKTTKILFSFVIAIIIFLSHDSSGVEIEFNLWWLAVNTFKEMITGLIIGFSLNLIFYGISFAGMIIGFNIGLGMAQAFNPFEETGSNVIGQVVYFIALMIFFIIDGHHFVIRGLAYSFTIVPLGQYVMNGSVENIILNLSSSVFVIAVKIAAPIIATYFLVQIGQGILARAIPQMQVFFVIYPVKIGLGFFMMTLVMPLYVYVIKNLLRNFENSLFNLVKAMGS